MSYELQEIARYLISKDIDIFEPDIITPIKKLVTNEPILFADCAKYLHERDLAQSKLRGYEEQIEENKRAWRELYQGCSLLHKKLDIYHTALKRIARKNNKRPPVEIAKEAIKQVRRAKR